MIQNDLELRKLIENGLVSEFISLNDQLTPNGFDLTVAKIYTFKSRGELGFSNNQRILPNIEEITWKDGYAELPKGCYKIKTNETIRMPLNLIAIAMPRSSLLRSGITISTGVWDAGFTGKSEFLLSVQNEYGFKIWKNARVVQLVFLRTNEVKEGYNGIYSLTEKEGN
jgi:dUTP pyrophosphatase